MKGRTAFAFAIITLIVAGGGYWVWVLIAGDTAQLPPPTFITAERRTVASTVLATGVVRLRVGAEVRVGSQLSGIVKKLNVTVGAKIKSGAVIAQIDSRGLQARLAQATAQVSVMEQEVHRAEVELARAQKLAEQKLAARSELEDRTLALLDTQARLEKARRDRAVVETDLTYAVIRAPISGTVASVTTQEGETVAASFTTPTFITIIDDDALELVAMVDETDIGNVIVGNSVIFTVEAFPAEEFVGRVEQIAPKGSIISGVVNFEVMIRINSPTDTLRPEMTANVSIRTAEREALVLPVAAVPREGFERFVYVERDGQLTKRIVSVGAREAGFIEIRQGLKPGERVLLGPQPGTNSRTSDRQGSI